MPGGLSVADALLGVALVGLLAIALVAHREERRLGIPRRQRGLRWAMNLVLLLQLPVWLYFPHEQLKLVMALSFCLMLGIGIVSWVIVGSGPEPRTYAPRGRAGHETEDRA